MRNDVWQEVEKGKRPEANFQICRNRFSIFNDSADLKDLLFDEFNSGPVTVLLHFQEVTTPGQDIQLADDIQLVLAPQAGTFKKGQQPLPLAAQHRDPHRTITGNHIIHNTIIHDRVRRNLDTKALVPCFNIAVMGTCGKLARTEVRCRTY